MDASDVVNVIITSSDHTRGSRLQFHLTDKVRRIRQLWAEKYHVDFDGFILLFHGHSIPDEHSLGFLSMFQTEDLKFIVDEKVPMKFQLYKSRQDFNSEFEIASDCDSDSSNETDSQDESLVSAEESDTDTESTADRQMQLNSGGNSEEDNFVTTTNDTNNLGSPEQMNCVVDEETIVCESLTDSHMNYGETSENDMSDSEEIIPFGLEALSNDLHILIHRKFGFHSERNFRLWTRKGPLDKDQTLRQNGITKNSVIHVDLSYNVILLPTWIGKTKKLIVFDSDNASLQLTIDGWPAEAQFLYFDNNFKKPVDISKDVHTALLPVQYESGPLYLYLRLMTRLNLLMGYHVNQLEGWHENINLHMARLLRPKQTLLINQEVVDWSKALTTCGKVSNSCIQVAKMKITVCDSNGNRSLIRLGVDATIGDLMKNVGKMLSMYSAKELEIMTKEGKTLTVDSNLRLKKAGLADGDEVFIKPLQHLIKVTLSDRKTEYEWLASGMDVRFCDVINGIADSIKEKEAKTRVKAISTLSCERCGRRLTAKEMEYQPIPAQCCQERSLKLLEVSTKDGETQSFTPRRRRRRHHMRRSRLSKVANDNGSKSSSDTDDSTSEDRSLAISKLDFDDVMHLVLRINNKDIYYVAHTNDNMGTIIAYIRRICLMVGLKEIKNSSGSMTRWPNWRWRPLHDCDIRSNDKIKINTSVPPSVHLITLRPMVVRTNPLDLAISKTEWKWTSLYTKLKFRSFGYIDQTAMIYQQSAIFTDPHSNQIQFAIHSFKDNKNVYLRDEDAGLVPETSIIYYIYTYLSSTSGFMCAKTETPVFTSISNLKVFKFIETDGRWEKEESSGEALLDPDCIALLYGVYIAHKKLPEDRIFLQLYNEKLVDTETGDEFYSNQHLLETYEFNGITGNYTWNNVILAFRNGDMVPRLWIPPKHYAWIHIRKGIKIKITNGRIFHLSGRPTINTSEWTVQREPGYESTAITQNIKKNYEAIHGTKPFSTSSITPLKVQKTQLQNKLW